MRTRTSLRALGLSAALALVLLTPSSAWAGVEVGAEAPDVTAKGFVNIEPVSLDDLKGRLILLELWKTT